MIPICKIGRATLVVLAFVNVTVAQTSADDHPMNVLYSALDENGFAKDPIWSFQFTHANDDVARTQKSCIVLQL
jgi:hypothetical protein